MQRELSSKRLALRLNSQTLPSASAFVCNLLRTERRSLLSCRYVYSFLYVPDFEQLNLLTIIYQNDGCLNFVDENDEVLISGFGRRGKAKGDIPGVRFKVVKVSGVGLLALWKEKKVRMGYILIFYFSTHTLYIWTGKAPFINTPAGPPIFFFSPCIF